MQSNEPSNGKPGRQPTGRILVIRGGALGDFILTLPVLAALRQQFPTCAVEVLGYPHLAQLATVGGLADAVRSIEARSLAGFFAPGGDLDEGLAEYFAGFALILSYLYDPERVFQGNVARCTRAQFIACPHRPDERLTLHAAEAFLKPLERLAIFTADPEPRLTLAPGTDPVGSSLTPAHLTRRTLALHPGSGSERKNWPEPRWRELLEYLATKTSWDLLLVGGEAEGDRLGRLASLVPPSRGSMARMLPLPLLAGRLAACQAFVGHDSGISHLAAAVGLPGLALWGSTNEQIWRPRSRRFRIVKADGGLEELSLQRVVAELDDLLARAE